MVAALYVPTFLYDSACRAFVGELFPDSVGLAQSGITSLACLLQMACPMMYSLLYGALAQLGCPWAMFVLGSVFPLFAAGLAYAEGLEERGASAQQQQQKMLSEVAADLELDAHSARAGGANPLHDSAAL